MLGKTSKVAEFIGKNLLSTGGLLGMYKDFANSSGSAINAALQACPEDLERCRQEGSSMALGCLLGRDRSGIISALLR